MIEGESSPYWSIDAEASTLGAALQDPKCAKALAEVPNDLYYDERHQHIHAAICALVKAGKPVDLITADRELQDRKTLPLIGGTAYLADLVMRVPTTANMKSYLRIIETCAMRRKLR